MVLEKNLLMKEFFLNWVVSMWASV